MSKRNSSKPMSDPAAEAQDRPEPNRELNELRAGEVLPADRDRSRAGPAEEENSLQPARPRKRGARGVEGREPEGTKRTRATGVNAGHTVAKESKELVPAAVQARFVQVGRDYYFPGWCTGVH
jgi:hypothetical protein